MRDSGHLIQILEATPIPKNTTLATIDVSALYLNIPHEEGIQAVINRLYTNNPDSDQIPIPPGTMSDLLKIVLTQNYFQFADKMYHQIQGTAMGTKMAPAYANLFMAELEEKLLENATTDPLLWKRYIDDILCIWPGTPESFKLFIEYLNKKHPTIKLTYECSRTSVDYLDITIYKGPRYESSGILDVKPFFKKTNKFQYLEYSSSHPRKTFSSIIKGEMTRLLRNCSDHQTYLDTQTKLHRIFRDRGYPNRLIKNTFNQVRFQDRNQILQDQHKPPSPFDTFLTVDYAADLDTYKLRKILRPTPSEEPLIPKPCLSLRKTKTIGKTIVRAKLANVKDPPISTTKVKIPITPSIEGNSAGCATPGCKCCKAMSRKTRIISSHNYKSFPTPRHTNCNTKNLIYLLECTRCTKANQYVGQTKRTMSQRLAGHRAASRIKTNLPLYKHFTGQRNHDFLKDARITILEKTSAPNLDSRERHWMNTLNTIHPNGLNSRYE